MAKAKNDTAYLEFLADLKALNPKIEEVLQDEKVSTKLREATLARAEFSSQMDALEKSRMEMTNYLAEENKKIAGWNNWYKGATTEVATMQDKLRAYESEYGELENPKAQRPTGVSAEEVNAELQRREVAYMKFMDDLTELKLEHRDRFKEKLDTQAVFELAGKQNLPLDVAYNVFIADRVEEGRKTELETAVKAARDEGYKEALSKHKIPTVDSNPAYSHVLDAQVGKTSGDRIKDAVSAFMSKT